MAIKVFGLEHSFYGITNSSINFLRCGGQTGGCITFNTNTNIKQIRLDVNGNLLIGKTSQANSAYKLDIYGNARANELVVNTNGADFVFEQNYDLISLPDLEAFIKQYKHLPEIPTAKKMQEEGIGVSEIQTKLLQKVEELTLYLIEKDKQLELQKAIAKKNEERLLKLRVCLK